MSDPKQLEADLESLEKTSSARAERTPQNLMNDLVAARPQFIPAPFGELRSRDAKPTGTRYTEEIVRRPIAQPPEQTIEQPVTQEVSGDRSLHPFKLFKTTDEGNPDLLIFDGKINGTYPSGMGFGNYIVGLPNPSDTLIYAGATFDPESLALTSRFLGLCDSASYPESRIEDEVGYIYWLIGFTYLEEDVLKIVQTRSGDINFALVYGSMNGVPALLPVETEPGWIVVPPPEP